jgi:hypothetical protein
MNRRASALILGLMVILVLSVLSASFLYKQINHALATNRYADSTRALWLAESGLRVVNNGDLCDNCTSSPVNVGQGSYVRSIVKVGEVSEIINATAANITRYYAVNSTGTVSGVSRPVYGVLNSKVSTLSVPAGNFPYGIESSVDIKFAGSSKVFGENTTTPVPAKYRDTNYYKEDSTFSFPGLFGYTKNEVQAMSTFYNNTWPSGNVTDPNDPPKPIWVTAPSSNFNGNVYGSGLLIVEGNLKITGTIDFDGIIYVIGKLFMAGTAYIRGAILAESGVTDDTTLTGTADVEHNTTTIANALNALKRTTAFPPVVVSWKEVQ